MKTWKIDPVHSEIKFKVKHLLVSTVTGKFDSFDALIETPGDDFSGAKITFEADINSINTGNVMRDGHLKSPDFFDGENHPKITFVSEKFTKVSDSKYKLSGDLTIRGTTKKIGLDVVYNGTVKGLDGIDITGFDVSGKINRFDFGLHWNGLTEAGGVMVDSDVKLEIFAEMKNVVPIGKAA